jgi:ATP-dependent DNA ligase
LVAYDIMEADGQDVGPEPLEERERCWRSCYRAKPTQCATASSSAEAITGEGAMIWLGLSTHRSFWRAFKRL